MGTGCLGGHPPTSVLAKDVRLGWRSNARCQEAEWQGRFRYRNRPCSKEEFIWPRCWVENQRRGFVQGSRKMFRLPTLHKSKYATENPVFLIRYLLASRLVSSTSRRPGKESCLRLSKGQRRKGSTSSVRRTVVPPSRCIAMERNTGGFRPSCTAYRPSLS